MYTFLMLNFFDFFFVYVCVTQANLRPVTTVRKSQNDRQRNLSILSNIIITGFVYFSQFLKVAYCLFAGHPVYVCNCVFYMNVRE